MSPKAVGVHSDWGFSCNTRCDWRGPWSVVRCGRDRQHRVVGGHNEWDDHMWAM